MRQYAVAQKDSMWTVFEEGRVLTVGLSRSAAVRMAEELAFKAEEDGDAVELVIQEYSGELKERRSFGD